MACKEISLRKVEEKSRKPIQSLWDIFLAFLLPTVWCRCVHAHRSLEEVVGRTKQKFGASNVGIHHEKLP